MASRKKKAPESAAEKKPQPQENSVPFRIASFARVISPETVGTRLAGYGTKIFSESKLDDLYVTGLCVDDGKNKVLLVSFDLIGLDVAEVQRFRRRCGRLLKIPPENILLSCTHTHAGPMSRIPGSMVEFFDPDYVKKLEAILVDAVRNLPPAKPAKAAYYSTVCDENLNRRFTTADNCATFLPLRRELRPIARGFTDQELGVLAFFDADNGEPLYVIGNYAAHALANRVPGTGAHRISADYPGAFRNYISAELGCPAMFIMGAAGDMIPKQDETGSDAMQRLGMRLAEATIGCINDIQRNSKRFMIADPVVGGMSKTITTRLRRRYTDEAWRKHPDFADGKTFKLEMQCVAIGDIALVGVPGELCAELGQEIKWHSPFRRTFIAYNSTGYASYICPANFLVSGGYEAAKQRFSARQVLPMIQCGVDALFDLHDRLFPVPDGEESYPDGVTLPYVNVPM